MQTTPIPSRNPVWTWMSAWNRRVCALLERGAGPRNMVLLLTTTGRKSGLPRQTPLQFEEAGGFIYVSSARGSAADWYRNILADPRVQVRIRDQVHPGMANPIQDPEQIADFFSLRLRRRPLMIGLLLRLEGLPLFYRRQDLLRFAAQKVLIAIQLGETRA
jgi:deazaflavin-dependent oxidoreductase (nitroreductase family)